MLTYPRFLSSTADGRVVRDGVCAYTMFFVVNMAYTRPRVSREHDHDG